MDPAYRTGSGARAAPRTAVVWEVLRRELAAQAQGRPGQPRIVVDVGGGTGGFAVPLAEAGHRVLVVDANPDALAALTRRADEAGVGARVQAVQADADAIGQLVPAGSADLVLCHSLLEVVDDPAGVATAMTRALRPGGAASVLVANRAAAVLARAVAGHFDAARSLLIDPDGRQPGGDPAGRPADARRRADGLNGLRAAPDTGRDPRGRPDAVRRRFDVGTATALLSTAGLRVEQIHGVRVVADLLPASVLDDQPAELLAFELAVAARPPYRDIATQLHLLARRPDGAPS